jgi:hypothetical protein
VKPQGAIRIEKRNELFAATTYFRDRSDLEALSGHQTILRHSKDLAHVVDEYTCHALRVAVKNNDAAGTSRLYDGQTESTAQVDHFDDLTP